jgi:prepilin-type N-terminal cleavage/methylation domain-containing protein
MNTQYDAPGIRPNKKTSGFTLVELLVVIAIIGILASIVLPNVTGMIAKGQVTKAVAEIQSVDTALLGILSDANQSSFRDLLNTQSKNNLRDFGYMIGRGDINGILLAQGFYQDMFYNLLRQGKSSVWAQTHLKPEMRQKLGNSYMDIGQDPWQQNYRFWMGPLRRGDMNFRSFRILEGARDLDDEGFDWEDVYIYNTNQKNLENEKTPGAPRKDDLPGYPAPKDKPVYVWSLGNNQLVDAFYTVQLIYGDDYAFYGGGDDINNWDNGQGWNSAPK